MGNKKRKPFWQLSSKADKNSSLDSEDASFVENLADLDLNEIDFDDPINAETDAEKAGRRTRIRKTLLSVVDNQIRDNNPPETQQTIDRLMREGHSKSEAKRLIACVLLTELNTAMQEQTLYNNERYVANLHKLPTLP